MTPEYEELTAAVAETAALTTSVDQLTVALLDAVERDRIRWRRVTALLLVVLVALGLAYWRQQVYVGRGLTCLLGELAEHRANNQGAHETLSRGHQLSIPAVPTLPRPPEPSEIIGTCRPFYGDANE